MNSKQSDKSKNISSPLNEGIERTNNNSFKVEDMVNMKPEKGKLIPISYGKYFKSAHGYQKMYIHRGSTYVNYIGITEYYNDDLFVINITTGAVLQEINLGIDEKIKQITEIGNYLIVATNKMLRTYLYNDGEYLAIDVKTNINFDIKAIDNETIKTDIVTVRSSEESGWRESIVSKVYKALNDQSSLGRSTGALSIRAAYRLIDGSYVMATAPIICQHTIDTWSTDRFFRYSLTSDANPGINNQISFLTCKYTISLYKYDYRSLFASEKVIDAIVFFASKPIIKYDFEAMIMDNSGDDESGDVENTSIISDNSPLGTNNFETFPDAIRESGDYQDLLNPTNWFNVLEVSFSDLMTKTLITRTIDFTGYYQDYATREILQVDQQTHHTLISDTLFTYNSRLWIANIKRQLASPYVRFYTPPLVNKKISITIEIKVNTDNGPKYTMSQYADLHIYLTPENTFNLFLYDYAYPDARATQIKIYAKIDNMIYLAYSAPMKKSLTHNYAYIDKIPENILIGLGGYSTMAITKLLCPVNEETLVDEGLSAIKSDNTEILPSNLTKLSELNNPLIFPALYTYPVGEGVINYLGVSSFPVSEGQFGQYPVFIFTSTGIYAANIGIGEVIITSVTPISTDIATSCPVTGHNTLFYATPEGIYIIQGNQPQKISQPIEGYISPVPANDVGGRFAMYCNNNQVSALGDILTNLSDIRSHFNHVVLIYDSKNKRLIVSLPREGYSYCFDIEEKAWYRLSEYYNYIVCDFPKLYSLKENNLTDITFKKTTGSIDCHFHSSPFNINTNHRKKIKESLLQCLLYEDGGMFAAVALFASNDGIHFTRITGNDRRTANINDIQLTYMSASYKYFVLAFWGNLDISKTNIIEAFNMQVEERYSHRLRSY